MVRMIRSLVRLGALRLWLGILVVVCILGGLARSAPAQDVVEARHDITDSADFRLRVSAALLLGRTHTDGARPLLEQALSDPHPAVRTAAAAALGALGDPAAIPALERRATTESLASVNTQIRASVTTLRKAVQGTWQNARYVLELGDMKNRTGIRGEQPSGILRSSTRTYAATLPGAIVTEGGDPTTRQEAANRHLHVLALDGSLQRLTQGQRNTELTVGAQVEFSLRRVPEQSLKGTLSGAATSIGSTSALANPQLVVQLQNQAIDGAVASAMRGAADGFEQATR
jgi:hypothetical protein